MLLKYSMRHAQSKQIYAIENKIKRAITMAKLFFFKKISIFFCTDKADIIQLKIEF